MDWMYKEHARNEESSPDVNNQSSLCDSLTKLEDKDFTVVNETEDRVDNFEDKITSQTDLDAENEEGDAEDSSIIVGPITSDLDELTAKAMDSKQPGGEKDVDELLCDSSDILSQKRDALSETTNMDSGIQIEGLEKMTEDMCEDEGNKKKSNQIAEERGIDSLKTKIGELEKQCGGGDTRLQQGTKEDLTTIQKQHIDEKLPSGQDDAPMNHTPYIKYTKLEFKVDTFFAVGSPLGVFLVLCNIRFGIGKGMEYWEEENISEEMPACRQMFNTRLILWHTEPLICKEYTNKRSVLITYHKGGRRFHIGFQEFTEDLATRSHAIMEHLHSIRVKVLTVCQSRSMDSLEEEGEDSQEKEGRSYGSLMIQRLTGSEEGRIDHMLQDKTFEHPYLQALGSHTNYWRDHDYRSFLY
ncbi:hypothetical protein CMV_023941 [Castanea mollissima]|uniref:DDHD domain-containing protein n=1 Tax=Castanea mollissima TaxID=60419 RepID=A0A8J4V6B0_9ROSI|nr:hypothetical protein CMV_023941 [Castanea mollissima]